MGFNRNVPGWERAMRALLGIALLIATAAVPLAGWMLWAALAAGATMVVTALAGFCPACAMVGRRL
jgi:acyl-CoA reductase-like NAD-dependent aldehyde dehydrogenase